MPRHKTCPVCRTTFPYDGRRPNKTYCGEDCKRIFKNEQERLKYRRQHPNAGQRGRSGLDCLLCKRPLRDHGVTEFCRLMDA